MNALISVVIPTIPERKKYLDNAINSVKNQTYKNIELIIVTEGKSAGASRNIGIKKARGNYIAFLDDDDTWHPEKLEKQLKLAEKYPKCPLITCYSHDKRFGQDKINKPPEVITQRKILNSFNYSSTSTYLINRYYLNLIGLFDESLPSAQEYELAIRLSEKYNPRCVPEVLVTQNPTEGQISENWTKKAKGIKQVYKKHKELFLKASKFNRIKLYGLFLVFYAGHIFGNKIYKIISPMKQRYEDTKDIIISRGTIQHFDNRLAQIFKEYGYKTYSISIYKPQDEFLSNFEKSYYLLDKSLKSEQSSKSGKLKTILRIVNRIPRLYKAKKQLKGSTVIGVSEPNTFISYIFHLFRKSTKIYFPYDITYFRYENYNKNSYLERFCEKRNFNKCNGIIHKGPEDELSLLPFNITDKPSIQFLPYSCIKSLLPIQDNYLTKLTLVYVGGVYPSYSFPNFPSTAKIFSKITELKNINLHIYPLNYDQIKNRLDYSTLNIHEPLYSDNLIKEISKYDYGIYIFNLHKSKHKKLLSTAFGNKVSTYLEAGLPVIVNNDLSFVSKIIQDNKLGIVINDINDIENIKKDFDRYEFDRARKEFTLEKHFPRMIEFLKEVKSK